MSARDGVSLAVRRRAALSRAVCGAVLFDSLNCHRSRDRVRRLFKRAPPPRTPDRASAKSLGDITYQWGARFPRQTVDGEAGERDWFTFTLTQAKEVGLALRQIEVDAVLTLEDADGNVLYSGTGADADNLWVSATLLAGTYYVRVDVLEAGQDDYVFRYGVTAPDAAEVERLEAERAAAQALPEPEEEEDESAQPNAAPAFGQQTYAFDLAENADGSTDPVALGTVSAADPEAAPVAYSIVGGNADGLFEIDGSTGALSYRGTGEDRESGTDEPRAHGAGERRRPARRRHRHRHGHRRRRGPGVRAAGLRLRPGGERGRQHGARRAGHGVGGGPGGRGGGLQHRGRQRGRACSGSTGRRARCPTGARARTTSRRPTSHELTVRASDGSLHGDVTVTVTVTDVEEAQPASVSEAEGEDLPTNPTTTGRVLMGDSVTGTVDRGRDIDWFAVELVAGRTYTFDLEGESTGRGTLSDPLIRGIHGADGRRIAGTREEDGGEGWNSRLEWTPEESGTHYVAVRASGPVLTGTYTLSVTEHPPELRVSDAKGREGEDAAVRFEVTLDWAAAEPVTVAYETADGTALAGEDYEAASGTLTFAPGETKKTVEVAIVDDAVEEGRETFTLRLSGASGAALAGAEATGTISGVERLPELRVADAAGHEGDDAVMRFEVTLDRAPLEPVTVAYETADGTALAGEDYEQASGTLTFAVGETKKTVEVAIIDDTVEDSGETFTLRLDAADGAVLADAEATGTILNTETTDFAADDSTTTGRVAVGGSVMAASIPTRTSTGSRWTWSPDRATGSRSRAPGWRSASEHNDGDAVDVWAGVRVAGVYEPDGSGDEPGSGHVRETQRHRPSARVLGRPAPLRRDRDRQALHRDQRQAARSRATTTCSRCGRRACPTCRPACRRRARSRWARRSRSTSPWQGDRDWYAVELEANTTYRVDLRGFDGGGGPWDGAHLFGIYDSSGTLVPDTTDADSGVGKDARVEFEPDTAGTYYISAGSWNMGDVSDKRGSYTLSVTEGADLPADTSTPGRIRAGTAVKGEIGWESFRSAASGSIPTSTGTRSTCAPATPTP